VVTFENVDICFPFISSETTNISQISYASWWYVLRNKQIFTYTI